MDTKTKNILLWIVFGALVGWIGSAIVGIGTNLIVNILVGIAGAFLGGYIMHRRVPSSAESEFHVKSFLTALLGAIILLVLMRIL